MLIETVVVGALETNCYLVACPGTRQALIIDPADEAEEILSRIRRARLIPVAVVNTHGHGDHIGANDAFDLPVAIHRLDAGCLSSPEKNLSWMSGIPLSCRPARRLLEDGDTVEAGSVCLTVIHTPGHTPGSICLAGDGVLFSGDTLFADGVGRTDLPGGDESALRRSLVEKVLVLPGATRVLPGHGPETTIEAERQNLGWML